MSKEDLLSIYGYQALCLMHHYIKTKDDSLLSHRLKTLADKMPNYINYQYSNMLKWLNLTDIVNGKLPGESAHTDQLHDYVIGLEERNQYLWEGQGLAKTLSFVVNKSVLDFGCGSGFYAKQMVKIASSVTAYDREEVLVESISKIQIPDLIVESDYSKLKRYDIIWISEVLHAKSEKDCISLVNCLMTLLNKDGILVINEFDQNSIEAECFKANMLIHDRRGKAYGVQDFYRMFSHLDALSFYRTNNYFISSWRLHE